MTEQGSARSRTPRVLPFGGCVSRITELVSPQDLGDDPYVGLEHLGKGTLRVIGHGTSREVTSTKRRFREGDILFGRLRPYLRKVARAPFRGVCSTDIRVFRARPGVDQGFLYYSMASEGFLSHASSGSEGTRMPRAHRETSRVFPSIYRLSVTGRRPPPHWIPSNGLPSKRKPQRGPSSPYAPPSPRRYRATDPTIPSADRRACHADHE